MKVSVLNGKVVLPLADNDVLGDLDQHVIRLTTKFR